MAWYTKNGPDQDVVISTRVRLARNVNNYPFPHLLTESQRVELIDSIEKAVKILDPNSFLMIRTKDLTNIDKLALTERHIISPQLLKTKSENALLVNDEEDLSIVILDEDHMRIQGISAGFEPEMCFDKVKKLAGALDSVLDIAYDSDFGYLTACPTNVGTGLRVSAMLHVPGLHRLGQLKYLVESIRRSGYTLRGYFGEGSSEKGLMIQISNQITLGQSDQSLIDKFKTMMTMFIDKERRARELWYQEKKLQLEDKIYRSKAILENARLIGYDEAFNLISDLRLGKALGFENFPDYPEILTLSYQVGVGSIQKMVGEILEGPRRDEERAKLIKNTLLPTKE